MIPAVPELDAGAKGRIAKARKLAQIELQEHLVEYFCEIASNDSKWNAARESDLTDWFCEYAVIIYRASARVYEVRFADLEQYSMFLEFRLPMIVVCEIFPASDRRDHLSSDNRSQHKLTGEWERSIQKAWIEACWKLSGQNARQRLDRHPFQDSARQPTLVDPIRVAIGEALKRKRSAVLKFWRPTAHGGANSDAESISASVAAEKDASSAPRIGGIDPRERDAETRTTEQEERPSKPKYVDTQHEQHVKLWEQVKGGKNFKFESWLTECKGKFSKTTFTDYLAGKIEGRVGRDKRLLIEEEIRHSVELLGPTRTNSD